MAGPDYSTARVSVRDDLREAHQFLLDHISSPGAWWTGAQRVAIATEARRSVSCRLCRERKAALSPGAVRGEHDTACDLPASVVDVIHRVRTDPARLSRQWYDEVIAGGLTPESYVELIGVVTLSAGIDYFARALGVPQFELPTPRAGQPSHHRPAGVKDLGAWVPMLAPEDASGPEADLYAGIAMVPNIVRAMSLAPNEVRALKKSSDAHYVPVNQIPDPTVRRDLDRMQMELIASRVSALNQCFY